MNSLLRSTIAVLFAVPLLLATGCANPNAADSANFAGAITKYLQQRGNGHICYSASYSFPVAIYRDSNSYYLNTGSSDMFPTALSSTTLSHLHQLVAAGLVASSRTRFTVSNFFQSSTYPETKYILTDAGKRLIYPGNSSNNAALCFANTTVAKIVNFTIPGQVNGVTASEVTWSAGAVPISAIEPYFKAGKLVFLKRLASAQIASNRTGTAILTHLGWVYDN